MDAHWRNTQKTVRFFFLDARSFIGFILFLFHARPWTLVIAITVMAVFWLVERKGMTFGAALRAFRSWLLGASRPGTARRCRRRMTDYG